MPSAGLDKWLQLEKPEAKLKKKKRGDIHIKVTTQSDEILQSRNIRVTRFLQRFIRVTARFFFVLQVILSTEKDQHLTSQEHKHLLKILFAHELQKNSVYKCIQN